jgi:polyhydroxyalkanoate synthesis regulator phasin
MVREALTNYLSLASGISEVTKKRARSAARALVAQGEATVEQVSGLAEEIVGTSRANRGALVNLIRYEVDRALTRVGLATAEELAGLQRRIAELEKALRERSAGTAGSAPAGEPAPPTAPPTTAPPPQAVAPRKATKAAKSGTKGSKATKASKGSDGDPASLLEPPPKKPAKSRRVKATAPAGGSAGTP